MVCWFAWGEDMKLYVLHVSIPDYDYGTLSERMYVSFYKEELKAKERWLWTNEPNARITKCMYEGSLVPEPWDED